MGRGCGGGGLRILPHKSWNVYGRKNIEKVRADESVHAESEARLAASSRRNESEWKLQQMRHKVEQRSGQQRGVKRAFSHESEEDEEEHDRNHPRQRFRQDATDLDAHGEVGVASKSQSSNTASSSSATPSARFVVQQEDDSTPMNENGDVTSSSSAAAPLVPAQHINLFYDVEKTAQNAEINRQKAAESAQKELSHARKVAPVSLFVESLRDEQTLSTTGFDSLRPWYAASEDQREAARIRRMEASKKQVRIKRREDGQGVRLLVNRTGEIIHTDADPLEEMKQNLRQLEKYESTKQPSAPLPIATNPAAAPTSHTSLPSAPEAVLGIQDVIAAARAQAAARLTSNSAASVTHPSIGASTTHSSSSAPQQRVSRWSDRKIVSADFQAPTSLDLSHPIRPLFAAASASLVGARADSTKTAPSIAVNLPKRHIDAISISSDSSSSSSASSSSSSDDSSSDSSSDSDSSSSKKSRRRRDGHRSRKHKKEKKFKKEKMKKHRSRSKERKYEKSRKDKRERSNSESKETRSSSRSDGKKRIDTHSSSSASNITSLDSSFQPKSLAELRAEREQREKSEREKAAALLQVPPSATFDRNSIRQREYKDTEISTKRR